MALLGEPRSPSIKIRIQRSATWPTVLLALSLVCAQLPSNDPWAHWSAKHYNASLMPGNDCVLGVRNERYDYFTGNSSSSTGGKLERLPNAAQEALSIT